MPIGKVRAVFIKELRDSLRDRRTVFATIVIPVLLYPVMLLLVNEAAQVARTKRNQDQYRIAVEPAEEAAFVSSLAERLLKAEVPSTAHKMNDSEDDFEETAPNPAPASKPGQPIAPKLIFEAVPNAEELLKSGQIQALLRLPKGFRAGLEKAEAPAETEKSAQSFQVEILFDRAERRSDDAQVQLSALLLKFRQQVVAERLKAHGLDRSFLVPFEILKPTNVATPEKLGGGSFGSLLPVLFILIIITGSLHPAVDMTAGEKERSTLETLISAPIRPLEVIAGKFLAVATLALTNALLNVLSFGLTFFAIGVGRLQEFQIPWQALPATMLLLVPLTLFFSALLLTVASFAASYKEAQVYCLPVYLIPMLGLMVVSIPGIELQGPLLVAPVVNTALLIKELFLGHEKLQGPFVFVFISTCLYAAAAVALGARVFAREEVLFSAQGSLRLFLNRRFFKPQGHPQPGDVLLVAALAFPLWFYFSAALGHAAPREGSDSALAFLVTMVLAPQALIIAGLPIAAAWYLRMDLRQTFQWRRPTWRALAAGACLGGSSWILAMQLLAWQRLVWPQPDFSELEKVLNPLNEHPQLALALLAMTPALCEEHLFRGFVLSGLRRNRGKWLAILLSGALFGAFHYSLYRQPLTSLLGFALGYLAWESRSIWPGVLFHLLHNGLASLAAGYVVAQGTEGGAGAEGSPELKYVLPAAVVFLIGLRLAHKSEGNAVDVAPTTSIGKPAS